MSATDYFLDLSSDSDAILHIVISLVRFGCLFLVCLSLLIVLVRINRFLVYAGNEKILDKWRPLLSNTIVKVPIILPKLKGSEKQCILKEWNNMFGVVRGESLERLRWLANSLEFPQYACKLLSSRLSKNKLIALLTFGNLADKCCWDLVAPYIYHKNFIISYTAAKSLVMIDSKHALEQLLPLSCSIDRWSKKYFERLLLVADRKTACFVLDSHLRHADDKYAQVILRYMKILNYTPKTDVLLDILETSKDFGVIVAGLSLVADYRAIAVVRRLLKHPQWPIRMRVAEVLGRIAKPSDMPLLRILICDKEWWVRFRAAKAIIGLSFITNNHLIQFSLVLTDSYAKDMLEYVQQERRIG